MLKGDHENHWAGDYNPHLAAMLESIDDGVGLIMQKLKELGLDQDTILIFSSDNGGETNVTSNVPLRGGKSQLYEGGIRVPLIVRWPGKIPNSETSNQQTVNVDFYPTLLEAAKIKPDKAQKLDGVSVLANWTNPKSTSKRDAIYWHYPLENPHFLGGISGGAIRSDDWKLIEFFDTGKVELYNLAKDIGEKNNLAEQQAKLSKRLQSRLIAWRKVVGATKKPPNR